MKMLPIALLASVAVGSVALAQSSQPAFVVQEKGVGFDTLAEAVGFIGDSTATIRIAPGTYRQCAVQGAGNITFRAATPGSVIFDSVTCEGKAALVLRGRSAAVDGIIFQNMRVPDANGAGIRLEKGNLDITNSLFRNSEQGLLTHADASGAVRIDRSSFQNLGRCDRDLDCAHSIYIGAYGSLSITRSRFEKGAGGHYVKTRSARVTIRDNSFDDSAGRGTNYMIDLSNGATGEIVGNEMVQGRDKENYTAFITVAPEGKVNSSDGLSITGNSASFAPGIDRRSAFVADWTQDRLAFGPNTLASGIAVREAR